MALPTIQWCLFCLCVLPANLLAKKGDVIEITDDNWREILEGEWMIKFYAPWCPACQKMQPEWKEFAEWGEDLDVNIAEVDVTAQPGLSGRFVITALPTIYHCKDRIFRKFQGSRTHKDFINFVSEKEWEGVEPVSSWVSPDSVLMSSMSGLFQLSMQIRQCHNYFVEDLGIPVWGSYIIFALITLFLGLVLGLILVFVADFICPSKRYRPQGFKYPKNLTPSAEMLLKQLDEEEEDSDNNGVSQDNLRKRAVKN
ncbi:thioredoxin-related transmembrane protein 1 [Bombina bombina]|uniref:thioredoxin-related transmembrane protein 1 n=2 Tax=Bombina bombina TaxID=8345 RepID=UPI00235A9F4D|nr:thioredoxin-related transmembrane protein 1 [Bombina bombina]